MQDFDTARDLRLQQDRTFRLGGQTFTHRPSVAPEVIASWEDAQTQGVSAAEMVVLVDKVIGQILEPGQEELWRQVRDPDVANPVSTGDMAQVMEWLVERVSGHPSEPSSASSSTAGSTTPSLTAVSSSPPADAPQQPQEAAQQAPVAVQGVAG